MLTMLDAAPGVNPRAARPPHALTDVLGPTRTYAARTLVFTPSADGVTIGTVELILQKTRGGKPAVTAYTVSECRVNDDWNGRGFLFEKAGGGETRAVFLSADGPDGHTCDCEAASYLSTLRADRRHRDAVGDSHPCKHISCTLSLVLNGWADHPLARPEASGPAGSHPAPDAAICPECGSVEAFVLPSGEVVCPDCLESAC